MTEWSRVSWTEAGQVTRMLRWKETVDREALPPAEYFDGLKSQGRLADAVSFLAQALRRFDAVSWAIRFVRDCEPGVDPESAEGAALKAALLWLQDPSDERRRTAFAAARAAKGAESLAAMAVFFSGGSLAPAQCEPLPAPPETAGRLAAAAVRLACVRAANPESALLTALAAGEKFARDSNNGLAA
jgi:hypothetical protein